MMQPPRISLDPETAARFAGLALACVQREYPSQIAHVLSGDTDVRPPRELTPAFYGCYDWHSAVHGHWCLIRLVRLFEPASWSGDARRVLADHLTAGKLAAEAAYLDGPGRQGFERPYGLAWLLQLAAELREWDDADGQGWLRNLKPLEHLAATRLAAWLPKLSHPIRSGEHSQTAFAMGLALDWARTAGDRAFEEFLTARAGDFHLADRNGPLDYEPSGHDFLSPCLGEADLMRRVLGPEAFAAWLAEFLPSVPRDGSTGWLVPAAASDPADGKLAHLDGLNLSRAWMLEGIAAGLPHGDPRVPSLHQTAAEHRRTGLAAVTGKHYAGGHWLASFAVYLRTARGIVSRTDF